MANGKIINYVGPRANTALGDGSPADNDHAGFGGYSIGPDTQKFCTTCETTGIFEHIQDYFVAQNPDIVLLSVGVNDFFDGPSHPANYTTTAPQRYQDLVNKILQLKPSVTLVLGTIEPVKWDNNFGGNTDNLGVLNAKIKQIADASTTDKIFFADIRNQFLPTWGPADYFDDIHLSQQGADKAATIWYNTLLPILQPSPNVAVTSVAVSPTTASVAIGGNTQITGTVAPSNATNKTVSWSSSNTAVATVNSTGLVTGVAGGSANITVTTQDGSKTAVSAITVTTSNAGILIPAKIEAENYTSMNGIQTETTTDIGGGLNIGYVDNNDWVDYLINVPTAGTYIVDLRVATTIANSQLQVRSGTTVLATVNIPNTGGWQNFQTVSTNVSLSAGTQTIRLFCSVQNWNLNWLEFKNSTTTIAVTSVAVSPTTASVAIGGTSQLTATISPSNATNKAVTWSSSNTAVATVNTTGLVTGITVGSATITVTTQNGNKVATATINVTAAPGTTTNLLGTNPSFESQTGTSYANGAYNGITGWALNNTAYNSISVTAGSAQNGNNKLGLVFGGRASTLPANYASITAGQTYTLSMAIAKVSNTNTAVQSPIFFRIDWFNSSNVLISSTNRGNILGGGTSAWAIFSVTGTAPANATKASCYLELVNTSYPNNDVASFNVDNVKLNAGSTATRIASEQPNNNEPGVSLTVYPMPTTGDFTVEFNGFSKPDLMIVDISGRIIFTKKEITESKFRVKNTFNKGVYTVLIQDEFNRQSKKIIIE